MALGWGLFTAARDGRDLFALQLPRMNRFGAAALRTPAMLVDAAPVVFRVDPSNTVVQLATRMRDEMRASSRHHTAGEALARLWPNGQDDYAALPQLNVKAFDYDYAFGSITGRQETVTSGPAGRLDLMVYRDRVHGFRLDLSSSDPAQTPDSIADMLDEFLGYLTRFAASPNDAVSTVGLLSTEQFDRVDALSTGPMISRDDATATLDIQVRQQISATPDAIAMVDDAGVALTYRQFDARVNAMAAEMLSHGVTSGDRVAVMLPRSVDLVLALHAVIRIGAAYVPIDVDYPSERIGHILDDSAPILVIADVAGSSRHSTVLSETVAAVNDPLVRARLDASAAPVVVAHPPSPSDTAYVIFTSGTTGRPKGVMVSHRAIVNRLQWMRDDYVLTPTDRVLQKTPAVFDVSVWEFFLPFVTGASLIIAKDQGHRDPGYLVDVIERHSITVAHFVPAMLQAFLDADPEVARLSSMRRVFFSGEALPAKAAKAAATLFAAAKLHNLYGPTEAAVDVTAHRVDLPQWRSTTLPCRSVDRLPIPLCRCSIPGCAGCPTVWSASSTSAECSWPTVTSADPISPLPGSLHPRPVHASTAPETWCGGTRPVYWSTWAEPTIRSRSEGSASNSTRSASSSSDMPPSPPQSFSPSTIRQAGTSWRPITPGTPSTPTNCGSSSPRHSRTTWCRQSSFLSIRFPPRPTGSWIDAHCPLPN
ncbi:MAG: AMP-binding protein [Rhodococcus sp. (in: high G+C Gram-positive bacteria)]|nr:AMP-binding protein [Rhodococcus sp. (in: high G+C Gram-positive bacteria)]